MQDDSRLTKNLEKEFGLSCSGTINDKWKELLSHRINELLLNDFNALITILYRLDVSEPKLNQIWKQDDGSDTGKLIAELVIERQLQKLKSRDCFNGKDTDINENERW